MPDLPEGVTWPMANDCLKIMSELKSALMSMERARNAHTRLSQLIDAAPEEVDEEFLRKAETVVGAWRSVYDSMDSDETFRRYLRMSSIPTEVH